MSNYLLNLGCGLVAFGPLISILTTVIYRKAQLVIVVTSSAFFFLLAALVSSACFYVLHDLIGFDGPFAVIVPSVLFQFLFRCSFVSLYHRVERVIAASLERQHQEELNRRAAEATAANRGGGGGGRNGSDGSNSRPGGGNSRRGNRSAPDNDDWVGENSEGNPGSEGSSGGDAGTNVSIGVDRERSKEHWTEAAKLRLELNDASCGVAAGTGYGGMHAVLLYGTLLASQSGGNNVGVLYQESCPRIPSLAVSASYAFCFFVLDIFWMMFTFFGMRRRLMFHRGYDPADDLVMLSPTSAAAASAGMITSGTTTMDGRAIGGWFGNTRSGGNVALLFALLSHFLASVITTANHFGHGCRVSLPALGISVFFVAYMFWAGVGRIYMPPVTSSLSSASAASPAVGMSVGGSRQTQRRAVSFHED